MLNVAYDYWASPRTILPPGNLPAGEFDFLVTVPGGRAPFQAQIERQFGYTAHKEIRNADVLMLTVRRSGLGVETGHGRQRCCAGSGLFIDQPYTHIWDLAALLENPLNQPVVDQTGLTNFYHVQLKWQYRPTEEGRTELRQAVLDQSGLELIPTNMPIEMFVVEKVK